MPKKNEAALTDEQLSAKYPGSFPFPEVPANADKELKQEIARVRSASYRKAYKETAQFAANIFKQLEEEAEVIVSDMTAYLKEAVAFLAAQRPRAGRPGGTKSPRLPLEMKVAAFFKDEANHLDKNGDETPGKVAMVGVVVALEMDPVRVKGALKRHLDTAEPAERIWVRYDSEDRTYVIEGKGANAPKGWTGYVPAPEGPKDPE